MFKAGDKVRLNAVGLSRENLKPERDRVFTVFKCEHSRLWLGAGEGWYHAHNWELVKEDEMKFKVGDYVVITSDYYGSLRDRVCKIHRVDSPKNIYVGALDGLSSFKRAGLWTVTEDELISLMDLDKPFKDLSDAVKVALFTAYVKGAQIQFRYGGGWNSASEPMWSDDTRYRIAPTGKPDSIDWSQVDSRFKYMARVKDGITYLYENKPHLGSNTWSSILGSIAARVSQPSYVQGDVDWKDSLVCR